MAPTAKTVKLKNIKGFRPKMFEKLPVLVSRYSKFESKEGAYPRLAERQSM